MIVATAGGVATGKTTLARALTGVDTVDLPDERRGGIWVSPAHAFIDGPLPGADGDAALAVALGVIHRAEGDRVLAVIDVASDPGVEENAHAAPEGGGSSALPDCRDGVQSPSCEMAWAAVDSILWVISAAQPIAAQVDAGLCDALDAVTESTTGATATAASAAAQPSAPASGDGVLQATQGFARRYPDRIVVVVTHADELDAAALRDMRAALKRRLTDTVCATSPIFEINAVDPFDAGIRTLRQYLRTRPSSRGSACLPENRVLTSNGTEILGADTWGIHPVVLRDPQQGSWLLSARVLDALASRVAERLVAHHAQYPNDEGLERSVLLRELGIGWAPSLWRAVVAFWCSQGVVVCSGACIDLPQQRRAARSGDVHHLGGIIADVAAGRFNPPWVRDIAARRQLPEHDVRRIMQQLAHEGWVYEIVPDLFYDRFQVAILGRLLFSLASIGAPSQAKHGASGEVTAALYRDAVAVGRKRAIQILEFFDRVGFTTREGDGHFVQPDTEWLIWFDIAPKPAKSGAAAAAAGAAAVDPAPVPAAAGAGVDGEPHGVPAGSSRTDVDQSKVPVPTRLPSPRLDAGSRSEAMR